MAFNCEICASTFTVKSNLQKHTNAIQKKIGYPCELCEKSYTSQQNPAFHIQKSHTSL